MRAPRFAIFVLALFALHCGDADAARRPKDTIAVLDVAYGEDPAQRLDVYRLPEGAAARPIILMVHGGAWVTGDKNAPHYVDDKLARWLPRGYVFVSTNYRLLPKLDGLLQANDVARALAYVQEHAADWNGDPARVILMGHSSGANLVALLSAAPDRAYALGAHPWPASVALDCASMDVVKAMQGSHDRLYDAVFGSDPGRWQRASPMQSLSAGAIRMLAVCSSQRSDNPCEQARLFAARARELGVTVETAPEELSHDDIYLELGRPGLYTSRVERFMNESLTDASIRNPSTSR